jgi:hypothetical protein
MKDKSVIITSNSQQHINIPKIQLTDKEKADEEFKKLQETECAALYKTIEDQQNKIIYLKAALQKYEVIKTGSFHDQLHTVLSELEAMLLQKNAAYGDSALNPARIFSRSEPDELIRVRIDDKLTRIKNRKDGSDDEDPEDDLLGYQVLLKIFKRFYQK